MARNAELREQCFYLHVEGFSVRAIGAKLKIDKDTANKYVREETQRRAGEIAAERDAASATSIAFYESVKRRALKRSETCDEILTKIKTGSLEGAKVSDHSFADALKAQERIDKIKGLDAPTRVNLDLQELVDALDVDALPDPEAAQ